jgi:PKD repeat protein
LPVAFGQFIITLSPALPVASFSSNVTQGYAPLAVKFTDLSKNATGWNWNFGDGANSTMQNATHTYSTAGNYTVTLTVSNVNGTDAKSGYITVLSNETNPVIPVVAFSASATSGRAPLNVSFADASTGIPTSWKWYFGDGENSTSQNPVHTFSKTGLYTIGLTVTNPGGSSSIVMPSIITVK